MNENTILTSFSVNCSDWNFGSFSVIITHLPHVSPNHYTFHLTHAKYTNTLFMFACDLDCIESAKEMAYDNAADYMSDYIQLILKEYF